MPQRYQIDYVEFPSTDGPGSIGFFTRAFGWGSTTYSPNYAGIDQAGIDGGVDSSDSRPAAPLAVIHADDLEEAERDVVAAGGVITVPAYDFPGGRRFHFRAPGGIDLAVWVERA